MFYFLVLSAQNATAIYAEVDNADFNYAGHLLENLYSYDGFAEIGRPVPKFQVEAITTTLVRCLVATIRTYTI